MRALRLPRRPILMVSPSRTGQVGSPTRQKSGTWPVAAIHCSTRTVPSVAGPSSSPVISRLIEPCIGPARWRATAATKAAMAPFMSQAPRPYSTPSRISPPNGAACVQLASPAGTTSVWPAKQKCGAVAADPREQVLDLAEAQPRHRETQPFQRAAQHIHRPGIGRRDRGAADQRLRQSDGIGRIIEQGSEGQSRSSSLIEVLARVCASTVLTITAQ